MFLMRKSTPLVLQYEMVECGAACLSMILRRYGVFLPLSRLRVLCGIGRDGTNLLKVKKAALDLGLEVYARNGKLEDLRKDSSLFPCIAWVNFNHFIVIDKMSRDKVFICDPAAGKYRLSINEASKIYSGLALFFKPAKSFRPSGKDENYLYQFVPYLIRYPVAITFLVVLGLAALIPALVSPGLSGAFLKEFLQNQRYDYGLPIIWISVAVSFLATLIGITNLSIVRRLTLRLNRRLTLQIAKKLFTVNYQFYSSRYIGDVSGRLTLANSITSILVHGFIPFGISITGAILILPFILLISWQLSVASFFYVAINSALAVYIANGVKDANMSMQLESGKLSGLSVRMLSDVRNIKASASERDYLARWQQLYRPIAYKSQQAEAWTNKISLVSSFISALYEYGTIALSGYLVMKGSLNLAGFIAFQALRSEVTGPLLGIANLTSQLIVARAELGRLADLAEVEDDPYVRSLSEMTDLTSTTSTVSTQSPNQPSSTSKFVAENKDPTLHCNNLAFSISPLLEPIISDISFELGAGHMLTIVGPSGSGKSTLIKVLTGLFKASAGSVLYGGHDWLEYSSEQMAKDVSYVSQDYSAFRGSIADNLSMFDPNIDLNTMQHACRLAALHETIMSLPRGYYTELGDKGQGLSGGQLQRLAIARALVSNPKYLFLDEATSALDIATEREILGNLKALNITLVCVAHRLISAQMSDSLLCIKDGKIIESGAPEHLKARTDSYFRSLLIIEADQNVGVAI